MSAPASACDCCTGVTERTPILVEDRPGLSAIAHRVGTHPDFLASMIAGLTAEDRPRLATLAARDRDDFTIALLDAWATVADVLTFYTERLAQESYLRTARERISLQELGRLIGYRLRPGVAAEAQLAFAIERPPALPPATTQEPGSAPPVTPAVVTLASALRVQSIPGPGETPQTFETVEAIEARPEWNAMPASATLADLPGKGATEAWLKGASLNLKAGDALLLAPATLLDVASEHWDLRILTGVVPDAERKRTKVVWDVGLGSVNPAAWPANPALPFVLRKRLDVFGHGAPGWEAMSTEFKQSYSGQSTPPAGWPFFTISDVAGNHVDLEGPHPDVVVGSWVVLANGANRDLWRVTGVSELSRAEFAVAGKVTRLALEGGEDYGSFKDDPRGTKVYAVQDALALADRPDPDAVTGNTVRVEAGVMAMAPGRRVVIRGTTTSGVEHAETAVVQGVAAAGPGRWQLVLERELSTAYARDTVIVHGNVAAATHGESVQQLLGSGRAQAAFQRFTLAHEPLTHRRSAGAPGGAAADLEVRVNDVRWDEMATLYGRRPGDRAYTVRIDERGRTYVQFGDGEAGARLPSGANNVRARYRTGLGAAGNVAAGAIAQLVDRPLGAKGVSNPTSAAGGVDPEPEVAARASIPLAVRTLGRAVSLLDYEDYARAYAGIAKAHATVLPLRAGRTIVVTIAASDDADPTASGLLNDLVASLRDHGDPHVEVQVVAHVKHTFRLALSAAIDPAYDPASVLAAVKAALEAAYSFAARDFVAPVHRSCVTTVVHAVAGVVAVDVDALYTGAAPVLADRLLAQQPSVAAGGQILPAGLLLLDPASLDAVTVLS